MHPIVDQGTFFVKLNRGGQPAAHALRVAHWMVSGGALQLGKILQMKNFAQLLSSYIRGSQPVADCTLIQRERERERERTAWFQ